MIDGLREAWRGDGDRESQGMAANIATLTVYMLRGMAMQDMLAKEPVGGAMLRRLWSDLMAPFLDADRVGRTKGRGDAPAAIGPVNLTPSLSFSHDVSGTSPGPGSGNFVAGRKAVEFGIS